jgi:hypothetical protein
MDEKLLRIESDVDLLIRDRAAAQQTLLDLYDSLPSPFESGSVVDAVRRLTDLIDLIRIQRNTLWSQNEDGLDIPSGFSLVRNAQKLEPFRKLWAESLPKLKKSVEPNTDRSGLLAKAVAAVDQFLEDIEDCTVPTDAVAAKAELERIRPQTVEEFTKGLQTGTNRPVTTSDSGNIQQHASEESVSGAAPHGTTDSRASLPDITCEIHELVREPAAMERFRSMITQWREWYTDLSKARDEWEHRVHDHFTNRVKQEPRLRRKRTTHPYEGWRYEYYPWRQYFKTRPSRYIGCKAWCPPELCPDSAPPIYEPFSFTQRNPKADRGRALTLPEEYVVLAVVHDVGMAGVEKINPWNAASEDDSAAFGAGIKYRDLCDKAEQLSNADRPTIEAYLTDIEADLAAQSAPSILPVTKKKQGRPRKRKPDKVDTIVAKMLDNGDVEKYGRKWGKLLIRYQDQLPKRMTADALRKRVEREEQQRKVDR